MKGFKTMKIRMLFSLMVLLTIFSTGVIAGPPEIPATPAAVDGIILAQAFSLDEPYEFSWLAERPMVSRGMILVLEVNPDLVLPRQTAEPVLYVGNSTAERVNTGYPSGKVVAIVPGAVNLATAPIWFGDPALPEQVTSEIISAQRSMAGEAGIRPFTADTVGMAFQAGGDEMKSADYDALRRRAAELIQQYAAGEEELATGILAPRVKK